jgi:hypothetical protein
MKLLFLDIDGVLNSERTYLAFGRYPHTFSESDLACLDLVAVGMIRKLCKVTGAQVVLSSSWRAEFTAEQAAAALDLPIISCTPWFRHVVPRGREIAAALAEYPLVTHYAIVDDVHTDMGMVQILPAQMPHFVHTDENEGLTLADYKRLLVILTDRDCAIL